MKKLVFLLVLLLAALSVQADEAVYRYGRRVYPPSTQTVAPILEPASPVVVPAPVPPIAAPPMVAPVAAPIDPRVKRIEQPIMMVNVAYAPLEGDDGENVEDEKLAAFAGRLTDGIIQGVGHNGPLIFNAGQITRNGELIGRFARSGEFVRNGDTPQTGNWGAPNILLTLKVSGSFITMEESQEMRGWLGLAAAVLLHRRGVDDQEAKKVVRKVCILQITPVLTDIDSGIVIPFHFRCPLVGVEANILQKDRSLWARYDGFLGSEVGYGVSFNQDIPPVLRMEAAIVRPRAALIASIMGLGNGPIIVPKVLSENLGKGSISMRRARLLDGGIAMELPPQDHPISKGDKLTIPVTDNDGNPAGGVTGIVEEVGRYGDLRIKFKTPLEDRRLDRQGIAREF